MNDVMNNSVSSGIPTDFDPKTGQPTKEGLENMMNSSGGFGWENFFNGVADWWKNSIFSPSTWQKKFNEVTGLDNISKSINSANTQGKIAYTKSGIPYDESNIDSRINAEAQEIAYKRDDTAYSRLIQQLKDNGINPALVLGNSAPMSSDTAYRSNYNMTTKDQVNSALKVGAILALLMRILA